MLLAADIPEILKNPRYKAEIEAARLHQERISFHAMAVNRLEDANQYKDKYFDWVSKGLQLPQAKFTVFKQLMQFPLTTTALASAMFDEFTTVFTAQDSYREYRFNQSDFVPEFDGYLTRSRLQDYISSNLFQAYKERHNSLLVVDMPALQMTSRPEPYFYELPIEKVVDIEVIERNGEEVITYIAFETNNDKEYAVFDDMYLRLYKKEQEDYILIAEQPHAIGYTPAVFISSYPLNTQNRVIRKSPLSESASDLDWVLFFKTAKRQFELYGPFPIVTTYRHDCEFVDAADNKCQDGKVSVVGTDGEISSYNCPVCEQYNLVGPGSVIDFPVPRSTDEADLMRNPVEIVAPNTENLKWITEEVDRLEWDIFTNVVGGVDGVLNKQAINEIQASAIVESKRKKYIWIASNFEKIEQFITDTFGSIMYPGFYEGSTINYGSQFDLYTSENVLAQMEMQKKAGAGEFLMAQKVQLYIQSDNRNNYKEQTRLELLKQLEPYPTKSLQEVVTLGLMMISPKLFSLKANFATFISRFELENGDIVEWGSLLDPREKVRRIQETFNTYLNEIDIREPNVRESGQGGNAPVQQGQHGQSGGAPGGNGGS